jgi:uncharacterized protein with PQ loop repeat
MMQYFIDTCGWIGSLSYSIYSIPQAIDALRCGRTEGLSNGMVLLLFFGALCSLIYILPDFSSPLFYNFSVSLIASSTIMRYHFFPRKS